MHCLTEVFLHTFFTVPYPHLLIIRWSESISLAASQILICLVYQTWKKWEHTFTHKTPFLTLSCHQIHSCSLPVMFLASHSMEHDQKSQVGIQRKELIANDKVTSIGAKRARSGEQASKRRASWAWKGESRGPTRNWQTPSYPNLNPKLTSFFYVRSTIACLLPVNTHPLKSMIFFSSAETFLYDTLHGLYCKGTAKEGFADVIEKRIKKTVSDWNNNPADFHVFLNTSSIIDWGSVVVHFARHNWQCSLG